ncbi:MAG: Peptidoglycan L-alanyl-D-glutamate endopeptidase CwlK [Paracidovorax wautersii]|uniref:Peptidoglycan L-alanyl-D-glutamate endopeptidase CwlK n=1 Tax=Paracidovorax wautersii TaxID=1177982 RepID=A0A7V8FPW7_9BURK|nr:MAG: Peptidoglycan L-alanyl-D-glutamate endopeptidase CwlK [Paracidovorax wautersii]
MVVLAAIVLLPDVRSRLFAVIGSMTQSLVGGLRWLVGGVAGLFGGSALGMGRSLGAASGHVTTHRRLWLAAGVAVAVPVALGLLLGRNNLAFFDDAARDPDARVALLLQGERLVPPPPLPPEVFATPEVESVRPMVRDASRNWDLLDEEFRRRLLLVYKIMREQHGYDMALLEGYRSPERQAKLAALGDAVTRADANRSYHQYGLAADNAFLRDGKIVISEKDPWAMEGYRLYGEVAESVGLVWGGRWSFRDYGHVEFRKPGFKLPAGQ